jgi:hypothetical protein
LSYNRCGAGKWIGRGEAVVVSIEP